MLNLPNYTCADTLNYISRLALFLHGSGLLVEADSTQPWLFLPVLGLGLQACTFLAFVVCVTPEFHSI